MRIKTGRCSWRAATCAIVGISSCLPAASDGVGSAANTPPPPDDAGQALCGAEGESCCAPPLRECVPGGSCNLDTNSCAASAVDAESRKLCRSSSDCPTTQTCCDAGLLSTCVTLAPNAQCPTLDLAIEELPNAPPSLTTSPIDELSCTSGCTNLTGRHQMLGVYARVINAGSADLLIGAPGAPGVRLAPSTQTDTSADGFACLEYSYAERLVQYELFGADGSLLSRIDARLSPGCHDDIGGPFSCEFLGLPRGIYASTFGCNELPIDGVAPGDYTLRYTIDPDNRVAESDESNNTFERIVTLSRVDALSACPLNLEYVTLDQECGWAPALAGACTPGELVSLGCPTCEGDPMVRVCPGSDVCLNEEALASNDDPGEGGLCPQVTFACPGEGSFSSFVAYYTAPGACGVTTLDDSTSAGGM